MMWEGTWITKLIAFSSSLITNIKYKLILHRNIQYLRNFWWPGKTILTVLKGGRMYFCYLSIFWVQSNSYLVCIGFKVFRGLLSVTVNILWLLVYSFIEQKFYFAPYQWIGNVGWLTTYDVKANDVSVQKLRKNG